MVRPSASEAEFVGSNPVSKFAKMCNINLRFTIVILFDERIIVMKAAQIYKTI